METPEVYIPIDRLLAIASGESLHERTNGAALFADISGFTQLTEAIVRDLGAHRGAEELTHHLDQVYDALIAELYRYCGSVISFSGDAITCWFDDHPIHAPQQAAPAALRAATCALAMQRAMGRFSRVVTPSQKIVSLAMKASVASGAARRFVVGDPQIQLIDVLAGALLERLGAGERLAGKGEVVIDTATVEAIGTGIDLQGWRIDQKSAEQFAVLGELHEPAPGMPWPPVDSVHLNQQQARPWLLNPVYQRLQAGQGGFLAELRPAVVLFLQFGGIDYDDERAAGKLDSFICHVQRVLGRYGGLLLQISIGDKGSYLYAAFGAPNAHEDDAVRAISAALELQTPALQIGISQGRMRTGAYGSVLRRTYGVIGDAVNLAARLMQAAQPGQILASNLLRQITADIYIWESLPDIRVKGKTEPVAVASPLRLKERRTLRLQEARYALPMVGRQAELRLVAQKIEQVLQGQGQVIGITGEAGTGKSRFVAEVIRLAQGYQMLGFGSGCDSYGTNTSYHVWHAIWQSFFGIDPDWPLSEQIRILTLHLEEIDPFLVARLPLLGACLNLPIPDNDLTGSFDAKLRKVSLEALLADCVRARARTTPLLFVLEDCHWLDPLSHELLEVIGRALAQLPVLLVVVYRPAELEHLQAPRITELPNFTFIQLTEFTQAEGEQLIQLKLEQAYGSEIQLPERFAELIMARSQGNPFYVEELLNYLKDREINPGDSAALAQIDLPNSLHSLILSRIDQLSESQKITLKVASIIGRLFRAATLWDAYPQLGQAQAVRADLDVLSRLELTQLDVEPELTYLFKHILTQEVAYESLPFAMRATLHDLIGQSIERQAGDATDLVVDLLAFHYGRSLNRPKQREYLLRAGAAAQADYANAAAIDYYERVLPLLPEPEQIEPTRRLGQVLELVSRWNEAEEQYQRALTLAGQRGDQQATGWCETAIGELLRKRGRFAEASEWQVRALASFEAVENRAGVAQVLHYQGTLASQQGDYALARRLYEASLLIRRELDDKAAIGSLLSNLGIGARRQGDLVTARKLHEEGLAIRREAGNRWAIANSLNNLGNVLLDQEEYAAARARLEEAVALLRQIGDRWAIANSLNNLGNVARTMRDVQAARALYEESLVIYRELGDRWALAYLLEDIGGLDAFQGRAERALRLVGAASVLREAIGAPLSPSEQRKLELLLAPARQALSTETQAEAYGAGRVLRMQAAIEEALANDQVTG